MNTQSTNNDSKLKTTPITNVCLWATSSKLIHPFMFFTSVVVVDCVGHHLRKSQEPQELTINDCNIKSGNDHASSGKQFDFDTNYDSQCFLKLLPNRNSAFIDGFLPLQHSSVWFGDYVFIFGAAGIFVWSPYITSPKNRLVTARLQMNTNCLWWEQTHVKTVEGWWLNVSASVLFICLPEERELSKERNENENILHTYLQF